MNDYAALLAQLRHLVQDEANKQSQELERQWSLPLALRVARGIAIERLRGDVVRQGGMIPLSYRANASRFRESDLLVLHRGDPHGQEALGCLLEYDDEMRLEFDAGARPHKTPYLVSRYGNS